MHTDAHTGDGEQTHAEPSVEPRRLRAPDPPSDESRQLDELTHADFAPWCPHCVAGKAPEDQHARRNKHEDPEIPVIQLDCQHGPVPDTATKPRTEQKMPIGSKDGGHVADMVERTSRQIPRKSNPPLDINHNVVPGMCGRGYMPSIVQFGEIVMGKLQNVKSISKGKPRWFEGIFVSTTKIDEAVVVLTDTGAVTARSIRRLPSPDQHDVRFLDSARGLPWAMSDGTRTKVRTETSKVVPVLRPQIQHDETSDDDDDDNDIMQIPTPPPMHQAQMFKNQGPQCLWHTTLRQQQRPFMYSTRYVVAHANNTYAHPPKG